MNNWRFVSGRWWCSGVLSWAPTLTSHDPNPPLPLESGGAPPTYFGILKRWTGAAMTKAKLLVWASWVAKPLKWWTGSAWGLVDTTGV